ncbi:Exonuclease [Corchorus capsularis]|uniref:RNA exonuclease 4 n=1 Tax=Corchorus capsularis TaxID=210143 RepID=A0A1R3I5K3_COCAP|nr:Exonuclease [Corchorus capsularis]
MEDVLNVPNCVIKVDIECCQACPMKLKRKLQKINGVYAIDIDTKNGLVSVRGMVKPSILIKMISQKLGKKAELYSYEKNPKIQNKIPDDEIDVSSPCQYEIKDQSCSFSDESHDDHEYNCDDEVQGSIPEGTQYWNQPQFAVKKKKQGLAGLFGKKSNVEPTMVGNFGGPPGPGGYARLPPQLPVPPLPPPPPPPYFVPPSYSNGRYPPSYPYSPPYKIAKPPKAYPYDFYEKKGPAMGNSAFHAFRDDNVNACSIMAKDWASASGGAGVEASALCSSSILSSERHRCPACYKQFKRKLHLIEHMKISYHSVHEPRCGLSSDIGPLAKQDCSKIFLDQGCNLCLKLFDSPAALNKHQEECRLNAPVPLKTKIMPCIESHVIMSGSTMDEKPSGKVHRAIALDCEMVGGGIDGSIDLCARVCLVDEDENLIFHTYVQPQGPVSNYRYEVTGITEDHLRDAMPLDEVQDKILKILYNGESRGRIHLDEGKARLLVGHNIQQDLDCLRVKYPRQLLRDTSKYRPLMKTNLLSYSLKHLTKKYLGYDIQSGIHDPFEDCISVMRLYKRMRSQDHQVRKKALRNDKADSGLESIRSTDLEKMTPDELYEMSTSDYKCWCLDLGEKCSLGS